MDAAIPLADLQSIYSVADVGRAREDGAARRNEGLKSWYDRMCELGGSRYIIKPSTASAVDDLYDASPNFARVVDDLRKYLALAVAGNEAVQFTPMLLLGEPGLGKTYFAKKLAQALSTGFEFVSMSSLTAGWVLTGASAQWHNARPGKVAQTLIEGEYANPVVVLDEVDKAGGDARYDPIGALYSLLEPDTASHFKDEFIDVDMDASHILWVATANDESVIPEPILNRMNVYSIDRPDAEGSRRIALAVYREILDAHNWPFPAEPSESVVDRLASVPPRDMRKLLLDAFGTAQLANRDYLVPEDIDAKKLCGRRARVGF
ncbi:MAG: AAA family ATPase [Betaproteobacteria bacterium]|nr:MAG: AAA family ATPase [Betaproteobacteria bacterium]TMH67580.1 MAG: AAA family ATPase [Betaproteobacteria bacterium]